MDHFLPAQDRRLSWPVRCGHVTNRIVENAEAEAGSSLDELDFGRLTGPDVQLGARFQRLGLATKRRRL